MAISIAGSSGNTTGLPRGLEKECSHTKQSMWHRLGFRRWLGRDDGGPPHPSLSDSILSSRVKKDDNNNNNNNAIKPHDNLTRRLTRKVGVGLPKSATFKRQNIERRGRPGPYQSTPRAVSADRRRTLSAQGRRSPLPEAVEHRLSAPEVQWCDMSADTMVEEAPEANQSSDLPTEWRDPGATDAPESIPGDIIERELEKRWILNLSMHFRDRSQREKFFVTYAESPNRWRRVTISCDYRDVPPDSLEQDLKELRYQRDKCARIYESLRDSLSGIQFYDTVTNLKLETQDGRLHVHVTEDVNEIIPYPPISCVGHLYNTPLIPEYKLHFDSHLSGFVYKVRLDGRVFIKKEIPGPETVDEFLYEINALHALRGSRHVIQVEGIVIDDQYGIVKGLLISYAEQGALVDILYEGQGEIPWLQRERWAGQIVHGLCEIHEAGYVQGDFTLANIVVDANNDAKIIDINRRGCPVGWEPPEISAKIESNQRISMYIGVKTDLFQLGMTLWGLAMQDDEPERQDRPLVLGEHVDIPDYYRRLASTCLSPNPRHRLSAKELITFFPKNMPLSSYQSPANSESNTDKGTSPFRNGDSMLPSLPSPTTYESYASNLNWHCFSQISLADGYPPSEHSSDLVSAVLRAESDSRTTPVGVEAKARVPKLTEDLDSHRRAHGDQYMQSDAFGPGWESISTGDSLDETHSNSVKPTTSCPMALETDATAEQRPNTPSIRDDGMELGGRGACFPGDRLTDQRQPDSVRHDEPSSSMIQPAGLRQMPIADAQQIREPAAVAANTYCMIRPTHHPVASLLESVLPINPRQRLLEEQPSKNTGQNASQWTTNSMPDPPLQYLERYTTRLSDSLLPINPALPNSSNYQHD